MVDLAAKVGGKPVLIPASDQFVTAIAAHSFALAKHFVFCYEAAGLQASLATKENQYALAQQHGMPIPRSQYVTSAAQLRAFASSARFPCLLKPLHCREWEKMPASNPLTGTKLGTASCPQELVALYESVRAFTAEVVVQEMIEGPDTAKVVYLSCYSLIGKRLASCLVRELRTGPIYFGSASVVEPVHDPETDALSNHFLTSIGYAGICELELKRDSRDGSVKLIEANPRYSGTADAAPYAGVDIGWIHYLDLIGMDVKPVQQNSHLFRHIAVQRDFSSLRSYRKAGLLTWRQLIKSYRPPVYFYDLDLYDWRVALATLKEVFKSIVGPSVRRVFPKR
jgi:predicted ATP-grasp superfamily ATP-dependent carboligase